MTVVVGFGPDAPGTAGLRLAGLLARGAGSGLVLCCVVHDAFDTPALRDAHDVDAEWRSHLRESAREAVETARRVLPDDLDVEIVTRTGRSVPEALRAEGRDRGAQLLVVGSAGVGNIGRISLGSTTDRLLHSSSIPVALAPRGFVVDDEHDAPRRILLAIEPTSSDVSLAGATADLALRLGVEVTVATFLVRQHSSLAAFAQQGVLSAWRESVGAAQQEVLVGLRERGVTVGGAAVPEGESWSAALRTPDWRPGDLLVVGSSRHGPAARVFLGSTATRILRHAPVPVVVLPRQT